MGLFKKENKGSSNSSNTNKTPNEFYTDCLLELHEGISTILEKYGY